MSEIDSRPIDKNSRLRTCVLIAGMHRSGTSALTRVVNLLGADIARDLLPPVEGINDRGFWESLEIIRIHDELFQAVGSSHDDPFPLRDDWMATHAGRHAKHQLITQLESDFRDSRVFVIKDPRISRVLPLWLDLLDGLGIEPVILIPVRNPLEIAASLKRRNGFCPSKSLLIYLHSVLDAELASRGRNRIFVRYDQLVDDWRPFAMRLRKLGGPQWLRTSADSLIDIGNFLTADLHHNRFTSEDLAEAGDIPAVVIEAYNRMSAVADTGQEKDLHGAFDRLRETVAEATKMFQGLVLFEREAARNESSTLNGEITSLRETITDLEANLSAKSDEASRLREEQSISRDREAEVRTALADRSSEVSRLAEELAERSSEASQLAEELATTHSQEAALREELSSHIVGMGKLKEEIANREMGHRSDNARLNAELSILRSEVERLSSQAELRVARITELESEAAATRDKARRSEASLQVATTELKTIKGSVGWRLTQPVRSVEATLRRRSNLRCLASSGLFDRPWYLETYPDIAAARADPALHYLKYGALEGRNPNPLFQTTWYLEKYPDVRIAGINPLVHYHLYGASEGRNPSTLFDTNWYRGRYTDIQKSAVNPLLHFLRYGQKEGRAPLPPEPLAPSSKPPEREFYAKDSPTAHDDESIVRRTARDLIDHSVIRFVTTIADTTRVLGPIDALVLLPVLGRGGSEKVAACFARALRQFRPDRSILFIVTDIDHIDATVSLPPGTVAYLLSEFLPSADPAARETFLFRIIQLVSPRICHIINSDLGWRLVQSQGHRIARLALIYGSMFCMQHDYKTKAFIGFATTYFERAAALYCKAILSDNHAFLDDLRKYYPAAANKITLMHVYNPVSWAFTESEPPFLPSKKTIRPAFLWAGRLDRQKRIEVLFEVAAKLPNFDFFVYGSAVTDGDVTLPNLKNLRYEGPFSSPDYLLKVRSYHAYIHTTYEEGLPNIILELGHLGVPIVAPMVGGIPEVISENTGYLLSPFPDAEEYASALRFVVDHPDEFRQRARSFKSLIADRHSWSSFVATVTAIPDYLQREWPTS